MMNIFKNSKINQEALTKILNIKKNNDYKFNYIKRIPKFSNIPIFSNNLELAQGLIQKTFKDFNYLKISKDNEQSEEKFIQDVVFFTQSDEEFKGNFIENFPLNLEMAKQYDILTNGINLFINFQFLNLNTNKLMICQNCGNVEDSSLNYKLLGNCEKNKNECDFRNINKNNQETNTNFEKILNYYKETGVYFEYKIDMDNFDFDEYSKNLKKEFIRNVKI